MSGIEIPQRSSLPPYWGVLSFLSEARETLPLKRRAFITLLGGAAAAWPLAARAQPTEQMRRIGWLLVLARDHPEAQARLAALRAGLAAAGWVDGRNLRIEDRWGGGGNERLRVAPAELAALKPPPIVVRGRPPLQARLCRT